MSGAERQTGGVGVGVGGGGPMALLAGHVNGGMSQRTERDFKQLKGLG